MVTDSVIRIGLAFILSGLFFQPVQGQKKKNLVYVDKKGILRYTEGNREASFFGVNYTVPFAYGYRSHKALGVDLEKAIDADVYHMSRLGLDAFRVHVWDVEITDSLGNLLENDHLRLFDYLLQKLKERKPTNTAASSSRSRSRWAMNSGTNSSRFLAH